METYIVLVDLRKIDPLQLVETIGTYESIAELRDTVKCAFVDPDDYHPDDITIIRLYDFINIFNNGNLNQDNFWMSYADID